MLKNNKNTKEKFTKDKHTKDKSTKDETYSRKVCKINKNTLEKI